MSELAYSRFMASYMLTTEEQLPENRDEIIAYTEDVLQAKGIECDNILSNIISLIYCSHQIFDNI